MPYECARAWVRTLPLYSHPLFCAILQIKMIVAWILRDPRLVSAEGQVHMRAHRRLCAVQPSMEPRATSTPAAWYILDHARMVGLEIVKNDIGSGPIVMAGNSQSGVHNTIHHDSYGGARRNPRAF